MPVLQPAEPWRRTGRYDIDELFKLKDRRGADLVLAMTHEEVVTSHVAAAVRSYRDLPLILYHFQVKERDEPRPARRRPADPRVHHEGLLHVRPRPGGSRGGVPEARRRLRPDDGPLRPRVVPGRGGRRDDGRQRRARVHGALSRGGERGRRGRRLRRQRRGGERRAPAGRARAAARAARARVHARDDHDRCGRDRARGPGGRAAQGLSGDRRRRRDEARGRSEAITGSTRSSSPTRSGPTSVPPIPTRSRRGSGPPGYIGPVGAQMPILLDAGVGDGRLRGRRERAGRPPARASSRAATSRTSGSTSARWWPATRSTAARSGSSRRSRSATSSSSGRATRCRSAPGIWTSPVGSS